MAINNVAKPNKSGIYMIRSISHKNRFYIGSAICLRLRHNKHFLDLQKNTHHSIKLQRHYNKYGRSDLVFIILEFCDNDHLKMVEQFYIDKLNPYFNCSKNAYSRLGLKHSPESIEKMRLAKIGKHISPNTEFKKGQVGIRLGQSPSLETREKISKTSKATYTQERKEHLRNLYKGKPFPLNARMARVEQMKKPILQYDLNNNLIKKWNSMSEGSVFLNISLFRIRNVLKGKTLQANGFIFKLEKK
jgi:group I intron endonuclease